MERGGADLLHIDVYPLLIWGFDYRRLGRLTIGPMLIQALKNLTKLPLDVHLAIEVDDDIITKYVKAGADILTVHAEACMHPKRIIRLIKKERVKVGMALNPATPLSIIEPYVPHLDQILLMTTSANFGGTVIINDIIPKVRATATLSSRYRGFALDIEVDGGVDRLTAPQFVAAGANVLVVGGALFKEKNLVTAIRKLRCACSQK